MRLGCLSTGMKSGCGWIVLCDVTADYSRAREKFGLGLLADLAILRIGNNYAITNESQTKTAKIFFAQGCEVDAGGASA